MYLLADRDGLRLVSRRGRGGVGGGLLLLLLVGGFALADGFSFLSAEPAVKVTAFLDGAAGLGSHVAVLMNKVVGLRQAAGTVDAAAGARQMGNVLGHGMLAAD